MAAIPTCARSTRIDCGFVFEMLETKPQFYPEVERAHVGIAAIQRLLQQPDAITEVEYPHVYRHSPGFTAQPGTANPGEAFLKTVARSPSSSAKCEQRARRARRAPSMAIRGLSRVMGPVAAQHQPDRRQSRTSSRTSSRIGPTRRSSRARRS